MACHFVKINPRTMPLMLGLNNKKDEKFLTLNNKMEDELQNIRIIKKSLDQDLKQNHNLVKDRIKSDYSDYICDCCANKNKKESIESLTDTDCDCSHCQASLLEKNNFSEVTAEDTSPIKKIKKAHHRRKHSSRKKYSETDCVISPSKYYKHKKNSNTKKKYKNSKYKKVSVKRNKSYNRFKKGSPIGKNLDKYKIKFKKIY